MTVRLDEIGRPRRRRFGVCWCTTARAPGHTTRWRRPRPPPNARSSDLPVSEDGGAETELAAGLGAVEESSLGLRPLVLAP